MEYIKQHNSHTEKISKKTKVRICIYEHLHLASISTLSLIFKKHILS